MQAVITTNMINSRMFEQDTKITESDHVISWTKKIVDTEEAGIKKVLIDLGWTPPEKLEANCIAFAKFNSSRPALSYFHSYADWIERDKENLEEVQGTMDLHRRS
jgi:hypothetical protein